MVRVLYRVKWGRMGLGCMLGLLLSGPVALAQPAPEPEEPDDVMAGPTEYGVRFTPTMARGIARELTKQFVRRYELDEAKADQATELMARRFMQFAHQNEDGGQELIEFFIGEMTNRVAENRGNGGGGLPREVMQGLGTRLVPAMPAIREAANGVMQDVRPLLPFKQQIKFTGEVAMVNVALDAFEKNMKQWSEGNADPFSDPFRSDEADLRRDENGETRAMRNARISAEAQSKQMPWSDWAAYVEEAKEYYQLDPTQAASVDSLLRDYQARAQNAVGGETAWQQRVYRNRLLSSMATSLRGRWNNPLRVLLDREQQRMTEVIETLGTEMKTRIEQVPTQAQRDAAEHRMVIALKERGLYLAEPSPATEPAVTPPAGPGETPAEDSAVEPATTEGVTP